MSGMNGRPVAAVIIVAAIVFTVPLVDAVFCATGVVENDAAGYEGGHAALSIGELSGGDDVDDLLSRLAKIAGSTAAVPVWFDEEIGVLPGARDVRVDGMVVGYLVDKGEDETFEALRALMEEGGWTGVPLGGITGATFVKEGGGCTWALVTCTQVGSATSVVTRAM